MIAPVKRLRFRAIMKRVKREIRYPTKPWKDGNGNVLIPYSLKVIRNQYGRS
jgi:hypothetical protein